MECLDLLFFLSQKIFYFESMKVTLATTVLKTLFLSLFVMLSCDTGKLTVIADSPSSLKEISAIEKTALSNTLWVIQDAGNNNHLYGLNTKGDIIKDISIDNIQNIDWEDLTSDHLGTIYIGDFGNNNKTRKDFTIYKVSNPDKAGTTAKAEVISFKLPKKMKSQDFESFFLYNGNFYIFSKSDKNCKLFTVPNTIGNHTAHYISEEKLKGKHTKVTSADISDDGKTVVLLNHSQLWVLQDFNKTDFFSGSKKNSEFNHDSQKEGINFINSDTVLITDEKTKNNGGNIYSFSLD